MLWCLSLCSGQGDAGDSPVKGLNSRQDIACRIEVQESDGVMVHQRNNQPAAGFDTPNRLR